jgi:uncharacterized membrane protein YGL010W
MAVYAAYHQDARNKFSHFIGVPAIVLGVMVALGWLRLEVAGTTISGAMVITALLLAYYVFLDLALGLAMLAVFALLLYCAEMIAVMPIRQSVGWFIVLFAGGWVVQLVGHVFEGRKPALADNLFQIFVAPIFLCAEVFFALGYKPDLHASVQKRALKMRADSGVGRLIS